MTVFRVSNNTTQAIAAATAEVVDYQTEDFDPDDVYTANEFIVPASLDGQYGFLTGSVQFSTKPDLRTSVMLSTDGGSVFNEIAGKRISLEVRHQMVSTGPMLMAENDEYNVEVLTVGSATISDAALTFFAGFITATGDFFRATTSSTQLLGTLTQTEMDFDDELFDTSSEFFAGRFTVASASDEKYATFYAGLKTTVAGDNHIEIQRSTDGGTVWERVAGSHCDTTVVNCTDTGPVLLTLGDIYRVVAYTNALTVEDNAASFFAGHILG